MKYKKIGEDANVFTLEVRLTSKCNYNCYYCTDLHYNKVPIVIHNVKNICGLINSAFKIFKKPINVYIYGGEPTIYPHLYDYIDGLIEGVDCNVEIQIDIQSNLSLKKDWWNKFCKKYSDKNHYIKICGSYHNTQTTIHSFLNKCILLKKYKMLNMITFMYNKKKNIMNDFYLALKLLGKEHCELSPLIDSKVSQPKQGDVTELKYLNDNENINELKKYSFFLDKNIPVVDDNNNKSKKSRFDFWLNNENTFTGCKCNTTYDRIIIDWEGSAFFCESHLFSNKKSIFNINENFNYDVYFKNLTPVICKFKKCFFSIESLKEKVTSEESDNEYFLSKYNSIERGNNEN
jgi:organic radical activating enzyme